MTDNISYCMCIIAIIVLASMLGLVVNSQRFDTFMLWIIFGTSLGALLGIFYANVREKE